MSVDGNVRLLGERLVLSGISTSAMFAQCRPTPVTGVVTRFLEWGPNIVEGTQEVRLAGPCECGRYGAFAVDLAIVHAASDAVIGSVAIVVSGD